MAQMPNGVFSGSAGAAAFALILAFAPSPSTAAPQAGDPSQTDRLSQLGAALAPDMKDVRIDAASADLDAGKSAKASLTLPRGLLARIKAEAATLGLDKAADRIAVRAKLSGDGYDFSPNRKESARLIAGRATSFHWQVKPSGGAHSPLSIHLTGVLHGDGPMKSFVLGDLTLGAAPAPPTAAPAVAAPAQVPATSAAPTPRHARAEAMPAHREAPAVPGRLSRFKLPTFGIPDLNDVRIVGHRFGDLPSIGGMPPKKLAIGGGLLTAAVLLWAVALGAARRKARDERRRRFRTFEPSKWELGRDF